jgi:penicillin-binding protein 1A
LAELYREKRDPVPLDIIPEYLKSAIITIEDRSFYQHSGVDLKGILRAVVKDVRARKFVEGASTITQQLAKTLFLTSEKSINRKIKEAILSFQIERRYTKEEILELYLNQIYFGSGAYGVESAAQIFFGKSVKDLSLAECALIAGMPKAPSRFSPLVNRELAQKRRDLVLNQLLQRNIISKTEYQEAANEPIYGEKPLRTRKKAPYFIEYVRHFLENKLGSSRLYQQGLTIYTTLSDKLQTAAENAVENGLLALKNRMLKNKLNDPKPESALIALDVVSGAILAMVGGEDFFKSPFNRATMARRQPGSAFKPILYALAIENGHPQNQMILDAPIAFKGVTDAKDWQPKNFSKTYKGEITLRKALAISQNIPAVRLIERLGPSSVVAFAQRLGISSSFSPNLSLALGTSEVTLLELTNAYAVFANKGQRNTPFGVTEVRDHQNRILWRMKPERRAIMSRAGAAIVTNMLQAVVEEGTGKKAKILKRPLAGKTGTTNDFKDALFVGYSPTIAVGVWVGQDMFSTLGSWETGAKAALPIWIEFMTTALSSMPFQYFDIPDNVVLTYMDPETGLKAPADAPDAVKALFRKGKVPGWFN